MHPWDSSFRHSHYGLVPLLLPTAYRLLMAAYIYSENQAGTPRPRLLPDSCLQHMCVLYILARVPFLLLLLGLYVSLLIDCGMASGQLT